MEASWKFSGGVAKANLILSITSVLHGTWEFVSGFRRYPRPISWAVRDLGPFTILAFNSGNRQQGDLPKLQSLDTSDPLGFLITNDNRSIALDSFPLSTFDRLLQHPDLKDKLRMLTSENQPRLIVVGHSEGGAVAALFTLWLLKNRCSAALPICITFGSPFIGNKGLQTAIGKIEQWKSQFWHLLSLDDPVVSWFGALPLEDDSAKQFMPFGTFLLLSESGYDCMDDPNSVFELLSHISIDLQRRASVQTEPKDYGAILRKLEQRTKYKMRNIQPTASHDSLTVDLSLQLQTLEIGYNQQKQGLQAMEKRHRIGSKEPTHNSKMLNNIKMKMAQLEWFMKTCETGENKYNYYDFYKRSGTCERLGLNVQTDILALLVAYWEKKVQKAANEPQTQDAQLRDKWLFSGNNYRRMVEPLAIADYYKKGCNDYLKQRHVHFVNLEEWEKADASKKTKKKKGGVAKEEEQKTKSTAPSLTHDSCFWARVEEASLKLRELENDGEAKKDKIREELREFEVYVKKLVDNCQLARDAFFEHSSFMVWWEEYSKMLKRKESDPAQGSPFFAFMASGGYKNYLRSAN